MSAQNILQTISERLHSTATVKSVYGDPIHTEGKTVVPIASIAYGFGGGFGAGRRSGDEQPNGAGEGGGGGGGVRAMPAGALEISALGTRFIPFHDYRLLAAAFGAGALMGAALVRRKLTR